MLGLEHVDMGNDIGALKELIHPADIDRMNRELERHLSGETDEYCCEHRMQHRNGNYIWVLGRGRVIARAADGRPLRLVGTKSDITARKQSEESSRKLAQAVEQAGESILIADREGIIEYVNPAFSKLTGYSAGEAIGKKPNIISSARQSTSFYEKMWQTILSGHVWQGKLNDRKKDGSLYPTMLTVSPIKSKSGEITHFVGIQQDLSEYEALENRFYQAQKMEAIGTLVGGIAHEFNNSLAAMTGNLYLAKKQTADMPDVIKRLNTIETLSFRSAELITNMLSFARRGIVQKTAINLPSFINEIINMHRISMPENIVLNLDIETAPMMIRWDANLLQQVVMNLLNNARDTLTGNENPLITISLRRFVADQAFHDKHPDIDTEQFARLAITDNGAGIKAEHLAHIFEPFYTTKEVGKGTGLGLSMVTGAIQTHHAHIEVESEEGEGSCFSIYFPLQKEREDSAVSRTDESGKTGKGEIILLADDEAHILDVGKEVLEALGYQVLVATDGLELVDLFKAHQNHIALIITDIMMPNLGGAGAVEIIRKIQPDIKIIFTTGYDKAEERLDNMQMQAETVLYKPYNIAELSSMIRKQLKS